MNVSARWLALLATLVLALTWPTAQAAVKTKAPALVWKVTYNHPRPGLLRFFRHYYQAVDKFPDGAPLHPDTDLLITTLRLADRRTELSLIYIEGQVCGTIGCIMDMVISRDRGRSFHQFGSVGFLDLPVRVLPTSHHGMPDFLLEVDDAGSTPEGHPADRLEVLRFDGRHYPEQTGLPQARHLAHTAGRVVIPWSESGSAIPLYPPVKAVTAPAEKK